jgi:pantoate--beta-alanine ligase
VNTAAPRLITTREDLRRERSLLPGRVAVVMTMGALHDGHLALVERAGRIADSVVVTVFVNPLQFGESEDYARYPRDLDADLDRLGRGVDLVFAPTREQVYSTGEPQVRIDPGPTATVLEGRHRPGHFDGVLTVVAVLLHLVRPHVAVFGRKDAQQLALVRRMVDDLAFDVDVVAVPTVRDRDGLALSSRNAHLSPGDRRRALAIPRCLEAARRAAAGGHDARQVREAAAEVLAQAEGLVVDYVEVVHPATFAPAQVGEALVVTAARVGGTRLIDNEGVLLRTRVGSVAVPG